MYLTGITQNQAKVYFFSLCYFINLNNFIFLNHFWLFLLSFILLSMYCFNQLFWVNLITLWIFAILAPDLGVVLKSLSVQHIIFYFEISHKLFTLFNFHSFWKNGKSLQLLYDCKNVKHQPQWYIPYDYLPKY